MSSVERPLVGTQEPSKNNNKNKNKIESEIPDKTEAKIVSRPRPIPSCTSVVLSFRIQGLSSWCTTVPIIPFISLLRPYRTVSSQEVITGRSWNVITVLYAAVFIAKASATAMFIVLLIVKLRSPAGV